MSAVIILSTLGGAAAPTTASRSPFEGVPDWLIAVGTVALAIGGFLQLWALARASREQAEVARASLMLKIDQIFEGTEMAASRVAIRTLRNHCEAKIRKERPGANEKEMFNRSTKLFSDQMTRLYNEYKTADVEHSSKENLTHEPDDKSGSRYALFMRLPYWMETVGMLTKKSLLRKEDVLDLYDAVFLGMMACFEGHVFDRRSDQPFGNHRFLEHALWIMGEARKQDQSWKEVGAGPQAAGPPD